MKKILLIILSVLCASAFSTAAFAETSVKYDMNTSSFIISGKLGDAAALKEVSVMILYPDSNAAEIESGRVKDAVAFSTQSKAADDLTFSITAEVSGSTGYYTVYYDYEGCDEPKYQVVYYVNKADNKAALQALNDAESADEVLEILNTAFDDLCFGNEFDNTVNLKRAAQIMYNEIKDNPLDTDDYLSAAYVYNRACIFDAVYSGRTIDFEKHAAELELDKCRTYDWYFEYKSQAFNAEVSKRLKGREIFTLAEFGNVFDEAVVTSVIYMPNGAGNVKKIMTEYKSDIGITDLTDSENVYKNLSGRSVYSYAELKGEYQKELKNADSSNNKPSGSGGSGGSGGGVNGIKTDAVSKVGPTNISSQYPNVNYDGTAGNYPDVDIVPWAKEAVSELSARGIISGDENGNFNPEKFVTREEFAKMLVMAFGMSDKGADIDFDDVDDAEWYYPFIKTAYSNGVISGMGDVFGIGQSITRQDMAVMIMNAMENSGKNIDFSEREYNDSGNIADYAKNAVSAAVSGGILKDIGNGYFNPNGYVTRAHAVKAVYLAVR